MPTPPEPEQLAALGERVRAFVDERVVPLEHELEDGGGDGPFPEALARLRAEARAEGLWNLFLPEHESGAGLSQTQYAVVCEEMGRSVAAPYVFNCGPPDSGNAEILLEYGSQGQRRELLEPLLAGSIRSCFAMTEPGSAGSDPTLLRTRAVRDGEGWRIEGHKWFTTGAVGASAMLVMAVTDPEAPRRDRATLFAVPLPDERVELVRSLSVLGHHGFPGHAELRLHGCRVTEEQRIGELGAGFAIAQARLGPGRLHHCMRGLGMAERALELLCERARGRQVRGGDLASRQLIQAMIADSRVEIEGARLLVRHAAARLDAAGPAAAATEISMAKLAAPAACEGVIDRAIQVHGAAGLTEDTPLAAFSRSARTLRLVDGADEVHRLMIARRELAAA